MTDDVIAARYARIVFEVSKDARQLQETLEQLTLIGELLETHAEFQQLLLNPDVEPEEKVGMLGRAFKESWSPIVRSFLRVVVSFGRAELLGDMVRAFQHEVDLDQRRLRVTIRSARPLPESLLERLRQALSSREGKQIEFTTELDPTLLGGVQIVLDHRVVDASVRRGVTELRQQLKRVRVH